MTVAVLADRLAQHPIAVAPGTIADRRGDIVLVDAIPAINVVHAAGIRQPFARLPADFIRFIGQQDIAGGQVGGVLVEDVLRKCPAAAVWCGKIASCDLPIALLSGGKVQFVVTLDTAAQWEAQNRLLRSAAPPLMADLA